MLDVNKENSANYRLIDYNHLIANIICLICVIYNQIGNTVILPLYSLKYFKYLNIINGFIPFIHFGLYFRKGKQSLLIAVVI